MAETLKQNFPSELVTDDLIKFTIGILCLKKTSKLNSGRRNLKDKSNQIPSKISEFLECVRGYSQ